jgi:hypothetical protein
MPNISSKIETTKVKLTKKSSEPAPTRVQSTPTAMTPEQESAVISRYLNLVVQERLHSSNASAVYNSTTPNKHECTKMGSSYSCSEASNDIKHNAKNKHEGNINRSITFSPIIPCKRNPPFASNKRPTKKKPVSTNRNSNSIKSSINNQVTASNTFKTFNKTTEGLHTSSYAPQLPLLCLPNGHTTSN